MRYILTFIFLYLPYHVFFSLVVPKDGKFFQTHIHTHIHTLTHTHTHLPDADRHNFYILFISHLFPYLWEKALTSIIIWQASAISTRKKSFWSNLFFYWYGTGKELIFHTVLKGIVTEFKAECQNISEINPHGPSFGVYKKGNFCILWY